MIKYKCGRKNYGKVLAKIEFNMAIYPSQSPLPSPRSLCNSPASIQTRAMVLVRIFPPILILQPTMPLAAKSVFSKSHILLPALYYFVSLASPLVQISVSGHVKGIPMRHPSQNGDLSKHSNEKTFFQTNQKQL